MTEYSCGFGFDEDGKHVALIEKQRPAWQKGKLNGVGGHIEAGESPLGAMRREFWEETGIWIGSWREFATLEGPEFVVHFFFTYGVPLSEVRTMTDEVVGVYEVAKLPDNVLFNLRWLIPLALDPDQIDKPVQVRYV